MKQAIMKETKINTSRDFFLVLPSFLPFELSFTPTSWLVRASCTRPSPAADTHTGPSDHATCCHGEAGWVGGLAVRVGPRALGRTVHSFHRHPSRQPVLYDASCPVLACPRLPSPSLPWFCLAAPPLNLPPHFDRIFEKIMKSPTQKGGQKEVGIRRHLLFAAQTFL